MKNRIDVQKLVEAVRNQCNVTQDSLPPKDTVKVESVTSRFYGGKGQNIH